MVINKQLLRNKLIDDYSNHFFHSIVHECFLNALPIDKSEMTQKESRDLRYYTKNVVDSIGGLSALEQAVDFENKTPRQNLFLGELYDICMESAKECAGNKCKDPNLCKKNDTLPEVVQKATLTDEECRSFANKANNMKLDEISNVIKKKTMDVIKNEKEQFEKEQEIDQELKDALDDGVEDDDMSDSDEELDNEDNSAEEGSNGLQEHDSDTIVPSSKSGSTSVKAVTPSKSSSSTEAMIDIYLDKNAPRHHISMFARLQDTAMEMMSVVNVPDNGEDFTPILYHTTFESFFNKPKNDIINKAMESTSVAKEEVCAVPEKERPKYATLVSIIVYTIMETLHTLGIHTPSKDTIKNFVDVGAKPGEMISKGLETKSSSIKSIVREAAMRDLSKMKSNKLGIVLESLRTSLENTEKYMEENGATTDMINVAAEATKYIHQIESIMHQRDTDHKALSEATESMITKRQKKSDIAQFNRINSLFKNNPVVDEIRLVINPDQVASVIDVKCANESGQIVRKSYMNMEYACESDQYIQYLSDAFNKSDLSNIPKKVIILINDGKSTQYKLK